MSEITDPAEVGAENAAWRAYLQSRHAHHATDAFRLGWIAGRDWQAARLSADLRAAHAEAAGLREALAWYADESNYRDGRPGKWEPAPHLGGGALSYSEDRGERARAALAAAEPVPQEG